jgi:DNA-directed RNA polymerase specialized sigma24 family protein
MDRIFRDHMSELYWLAFLLTGDRERSVQAYTGALNSENPAPGLQRFMLSWARKLVIVAALGTIRRELREGALVSGTARADELGSFDRTATAQLAHLSKDELEDVLLRMDVFRRCVLILTVLEGLPVEEVAGLVGTDPKTVKTAQARGIAEMTWKLAGILSLDSEWTFGPAGRGRAMVAFG